MLREKRKLVLGSTDIAKGKPFNGEGRYASWCGIMDSGTFRCTDTADRLQQIFVHRLLFTRRSIMKTIYISLSCIFAALVVVLALAFIPTQAVGVKSENIIANGG